MEIFADWFSILAARCERVFAPQKKIWVKSISGHNNWTNAQIAFMRDVPQDRKTALGSVTRALKSNCMLAYLTSRHEYPGDTVYMDAEVHDNICLVTDKLGPVFTVIHYDFKKG